MLGTRPRAKDAGRASCHLRFARITAPDGGRRLTGGIFFGQQVLTRFQFATQRVSHFAMGGPCRLLRQRREAHAGGSLHYSPKRG